MNLNALVTQILFNYISCSYANNITIQSFTAAEITYCSSWYLFRPIKLQKLITPMIQRAQKPFYLKGYNIVDCSMTTFLTVK